MYRRTSDFFRERGSVLVTAETRGVPYKIVSIFLGVLYIMFGIRNVLFCGFELPVGDGEAIIMDMWKNCKNDKAMELHEGLHGLGDWMIAIVRLTMATTESTADLFHTMLILAFYSIGFFIGCARVGFEDLALFYSAFMFCGLFYENYVCYIAYLAYMSRLKTKVIMNETEDLPLKPTLLIQGAGWALFAIRSFFVCNQPYILWETETEVNFFNSTWHDCLSHPRPNIRNGWANMAGVHSGLVAAISIFLFFTMSMKTVLKGSSLLVFYTLGTLYLIVRAGTDVVPPVYTAFVVAGVAYNSYILYLAYKYDPSKNYKVA